MKRSIPILIALICIVYNSNLLHSQVTTTPNANANALVNSLVGTGITFSNATLTCAAGGAGTFTTTGPCNMGLGTGVLLTSGNVTNANGPNNSGSSGTVNGTAGFPLLDGLAGAGTQDACYLTFDFIPVTTSVSFSYVFGSEEYPEFVNSGFNDAFGFFLTGPGGYSNTNIATLPIAGNPPVTIDNVNATTNPGFYVNNAAGTCVQYDAMTTTLTANATVVPCSTYTITIAVADAGDGSYDSGVFFQENSFNANPVFTVSVINQTNATCSTTGSATAQANGGTGPISYSWNTNPVQNTATATNLTPGTYTVTASYTTCSQIVTATNTVTITGPTPFIPTATNTGPYCPGQTIQLNSPMGSGTDDWTGPLGYNQPNTQNPTIASSTAAMSGIYTVTVTNGAGCTGTATTTVVVNPVPTPTATNTGPYCAGATIQLNSPTGSATDDWTGPGGYNQPNVQNPTRPTSTPAMAGVYTVTVTGAGGCSATATTTVVVNPLPTPVATNTGPYCAGATIQLNSPSGSATDDWTGPNTYTQANTQNPTIATSTAAMSGVYTVSVTDAAGCSATATTTVVVNPSPVPTATNTGPYCAGQTIQLNSPTGSATDDWAGPNTYTQANTQNPTIGSAAVGMSGVYTVTVTNANGCSATATTTVVVNPLPTPTATNTGPYCTGSTIQLNSPTGSATDDWTGPGGYSQNDSQNPTRPTSTVAMAGIYTVTVTNAGGCSATATTTVVVNPSPIPTATNTGPYCAGATIQLNSPTGSATDDWAGPNTYTQANTQNPTIGSSTAAMSGIYTVTVTNASGCSATATTTVVVNPLPTPTATNTGPYCTGQTIQLNSPAGSAADDWNGPAGYNQPNTQNPTIPSANVGMAGVYTVTVTSAAGCSATATTTVAVNPLPTPVANNTGPYCAGSTIQLNSPTGSATDDWAGPVGYSQANTQNPVIGSSTAAMSGIYTVTVTNANGCSATATTTVVVNPLPTPVANNTGPYCAGSTIQLNSPTGSATDDWTGPNTFAQVNTQNPTIGSSTAAMSGVYTVTVTNVNGCSATATTTVVVNPLPTPTATNTGPYCPGSTIQLNSPTGSGTDDWTGPNGFNQLNTQNPTIASANAAMGGVYTVTVTNANGCSATATTTVVINVPGAATASNTGPYCAGATINLSAGAGPVDFDWTGPSGYVSNNTQNPTIPTSTVAMGGVYTVTVTMTGGCTATGTTTVIVNPLPTPTANNTGPYCAGNTIQLNSPTGSATDDWTGPNSFTQSNIQNPTIGSSTAAMAGIYTVTVTNGNGCSATATTSVVVNPLPTPTANNTGPYCSGNTIQLNSPAGNTNDDWTGPNGYNQLNALNPTIASSSTVMAGVYTVTVTSAAGCSASATTTVVVNPLPTPVATNTGPYCTGTTIQLNSPTGSASDDWTGPTGYSQANTQNPTRPSSTVAMSGIYTVTVTDGNNCSATATTTVVVNPLPTPTANNTGPYCAGATIQLNSPAGNGNDDWAGPNTYAQSNIQNPTITSSTVGMSGVYTVTVTDGNNCSATASTTVVVNALPTPTATNTGPYCAGNTIQLNSPSGNGNDDWTGPSGYVQNNTQNPTLATATLGMNGVYTVTVTNANNCSASATTTVVVNALPTPTATNTGPYCAGDSIQLNSPLGNTNDDWTGPSAYSQNNVQNPVIGSSTTGMNGTYIVTVTDANNCSATATTTVIVNALPTPLANNTGPYCHGDTMSLSSSGGVDFDWNGPNGFVLANTQNGDIPSSTPNMSGVYTVTVTDANGCVNTTNTTVTVNPLPNAQAGNDSPVCEFQNVNLNSSGGVDYDWTGPNGYTEPNNQNPVIISATPTQSGTYTVTVTDANGCISTATTSLSINPDLVFNATSNSAICAGTTLTLNADNIPTATYNWSGPNGFTANNQQNPTIQSSTVAATGTYTVLATNSGGCTGTATVNVIINPMPAAAFSGDNLSGCAPVCVNFSDLTATNGSTIASWSWTVEGQTTSSTQNTAYCFADPGQYDASLTVTSTDGCVSTLSFTDYITVNSNPIASFEYSPDEIFFSEPEVTFGSTSINATNWTWDFGDGGTGAGENTIHMYQDTGFFCVTLTATNAAGCMDTSVSCLHVKPVFSLYIPNTFTPNGDGTNETWNIYGEGIKTITVRIFDRWGEEIFSFDTIDKGWPGTTTNQQPCMQGVYVYRVEVVDGKNDFHEYIGNVNLIR